MQYFFQEGVLLPTPVDINLYDKRPVLSGVLLCRFYRLFIHGTVIAVVRHKAYSLDGLQPLRCCKFNFTLLKPADIAIHIEFFHKTQLSLSPEHLQAINTIFFSLWLGKHKTVSFMALPLSLFKDGV